MESMTSGPSTVAVIIAGGQGRRLGSVDKSFAELGGRPLIAHVIDRIAPQVSTVLVNTTGDVDRFLAFGLTVVADRPRSTLATGPLVGLTSAFAALSRSGDLTSAVLSCPVDTPFLPTDLVARLTAALTRSATAVAFAATASCDHPLIALWTPWSREPVGAVFDQQPEISLHGIMERMRGARVIFGDGSPIDPFFNINTADDLDTAERLMSRSC
jgi:molybdopterin-guanine dinucleotide biosynthesis protein A